MISEIPIYRSRFPKINICREIGKTTPIQWVSGAFSPGVKRPGREADHSPLTSAEMKNVWIYTSTITYAFMA
jgi:hypothetical protein